MDSEPLQSVFYKDGRAATLQVEGLLGEGAFQFPKDVDILADILSVLSAEGDIILDSFAGSGSTGHAVLKLNMIGAIDRSFILIEMDGTTAAEKTAKRLNACIEGYTEAVKPFRAIDALGGGFKFCKLGEPLFNEFGDIDHRVTFSDLAAHIFFSETGAPLPQKAKNDCSFIGTYKEKAVYLLFSAAEQGVAREAAGNVLTPDVLAQLSPIPECFTGQRVVYGEGCTVSADRLKAEGVTFKQIPYQIEAN
ncbi:DNA methyltransferase [Sphingobium sp. D43FB]|uniref:DNA methyltransferase n=1 Tax=Sphingobium sp. D43FB TaxID=2017595 RepID=UPI0020D07225|nr:DNA methyltransferase [Sphingobium sp. D43FB]